MIIVTGGAGFIGQHLCKALLHLNEMNNRCEEILCIDNLYCSEKPRIEHEQFTFLYDDINDEKNLSARFGNQKITAIYHLACPASPPNYQSDPLFTIRTCVDGTRNMLELARKHKCPILFTSTSEVYGEPEIAPQHESYRGNVNSLGPRACYDNGKRMAETLMFEYHRRFGVKIHVARLFNTYGPGMSVHDGRVVTNFAHQALRLAPLTVYGDGSQTRSFCYVGDTVRGLVLLMASDQTGPINLGNPHEITIAELALRVQCRAAELLTAAAAGSSAPKDFFSEHNIVYKPLPEDDPTRRCPDITMAQNLLGWQPTTTLEQGLKLTMDEIYGDIEKK